MAAQTFTYQARDRSGTLVAGSLEAENEAQVRSNLRMQGMRVLDIRVGAARGRRGVKRVKTKDLAIFSRQFAAMLSSGLPLIRALTIQSEQTANDTLRATLNIARIDIEGGLSLSAAFEKHPHVFPNLMINMIRAGELGGFLDTTMQNVATNLESEVRLRSKIKAAMTYPVVVLCISILMCIAMLLFVVPTFRDMFQSLGGQLPLPTRILVMLSDSMKYLLPVAVACGFAAAIWWRRNRQSDRVRAVVDPLKLRLPVFGPLFQKIALARFSRNLSSMLNAGVPILQALDVVADTSGSVVIAKAVRAVQDSVRQGQSFTAPLSGHKIFPSMVAQMIGAGEETGDLSGMLDKISEYYDQEVEVATESLTAMIEPLMIVVLGVIVGSMIVSLYLPIFSVFKLVH